MDNLKRDVRVRHAGSQQLFMQNERIEKPNETNESPARKDLIDPIDESLRTHEQYSSTLQAFRAAEKLHVLHLFVYHYRVDLEQICDSLDSTAQAQLRSFVDSTNQRSP